MHDVSNASDHAQLLRHALRDEVANVEPRPLLPEILAAARRCDPWLIALIGVLNLLVIAAALAWLHRHPEPAPAPPATATTRPMEA